MRKTNGRVEERQTKNVYEYRNLLYVANMKYMYSLDIAAVTHNTQNVIIFQMLSGRFHLISSVIDIQTHTHTSTSYGAIRSYNIGRMIAQHNVAHI